MKITQKNLAAVAERIGRIDLLKSGPPTPPWGDQLPQLDQLTELLDREGSLLPLIYKDAYVDPVRESTDKILRFAKGESGPGMPDPLYIPVILETIFGPIYGYAPDSPVAEPLRRFQATVVDLFRSFLDSERRMHAGVPLIEKIAPLATYQRKAQYGPFTIPAGVMQAFTNSTVAVVSLPSAYRDDPLLWGLLAHETGGHDVQGADPGLLKELATHIRNLFDGDEKILGELWAYWISEASSDVYGVLNVGPTFSLVLTPFLSALMAQVSSGAMKVPAVRSSSGPNEDGTLDPHPTDLLRIDLAMGAIEALNHLNDDLKQAYLDTHETLSRMAAGGNTKILLQGALSTGKGGTDMSGVYSLADMRTAARRVGSHIVTTKLDALGGKSIQDLETWDDEDESTAERITEALGDGTAIGELGDAAHMIAGAALAVLREPSAYETATEGLIAGLDFAIDTDPIWGKS